MENRHFLNEEDILKNMYNKDKEYYNSSLHFQYDKLSVLDMDIVLTNDLTIFNLPYLHYISEKVVVEGYYYIEKCPLLKTLNFKKGSAIYFDRKQHLITILSKEQFSSLRALWVEGKRIFSYEEYYSLVKDSAVKENLLKICL